ncbi:Putative acyl-CoA dehydrogenase AidB [BD1-7 clade bacterium]|uniref:Acyl-CoA dehydrogenase AidB n=1 Tax=BD1-7 clade bacterium TaxID=2029982 RepID=A0A5S9QWA4_9GAMM|nr:Putative acyl-CoA dehydrogenase AidB [BD1-7 clade bacterium]CAA0122828.1 Putative acyl-CoA dehydrogenase AidB [BD1-7 clade bacterium]
MNNERGCNHRVFNQPKTSEPTNIFATDPLLSHYLQRFGDDIAGADTIATLNEYGELAGSYLTDLGDSANRHKPETRIYDRYGHRIDQVDFHPAYHELLTKACQYGIHNLPWSNPEPGTHLLRAMLFYLHNQADAGTACPITMTFAGYSVIEREDHLDAFWRDKLLSTDYDPTARHASEKNGLMLGMAMTEKQGGTDIRANTTEATLLDNGAATWQLNGHKWFCSAPMSDGFLTLAQTDAGLSCFLAPKWLPGDTPNGILIQRLKDKLGNHSNASSEIEYHDCLAYLLGEPGKGIRTIMQMVGLTRYDCALGSAALMRQAMVQAWRHCTQRSVMGKLLINQPLMQNVLADLALESDAATLLALRLSRCLDSGTAEEMALFRIGTAVAKYWICKQAPAFINEAAECMGGAGYVEEFILPRLYREAPVNSLWEGSGNVQCLDVLRAMNKEPECVDALTNELKSVQGSNTRYDQHLAKIPIMLKGDPGELEFSARTLTAAIAQCWQAKLMMEFYNDDIFADFCRSRLSDHHARNYGQLDAKTHIDAILNAVVV